MKKIVRATLCLALAAVMAGGCASGRTLPGPGESTGSLPDLRGRSVLVLPVQLREGVPAAATADEELSYALRARGSRVQWTFPPELESALRRSPGLPARMRDLPVGVFLQAEVKRIGDPLYGDIRRLTVLTGSELALIPVELRYADDGAYRLTAVLLTARDGRVSWLGVVQGKALAPEAPEALASVADALARAVLPLGS